MDFTGIFQYKETEHGIAIYACKSLDGRIVVPERIGGLPVTELAAYAFSERRIHRTEGEWSLPGEDSLWDRGETAEMPLLCGDRLESVELPASIEKIGNYAFYNCYSLRRIACHSTVKDLGSGMFTGCGHIEQVDITIHDGEKSCMKELLSEIRQRVLVRYIAKEGTALLIFPEFFEEAVENTPARILYTTTHGAGHRYRYCFQDTNFKFKEYDGLFIHEMARETTKEALELSLYRLLYPLELSGDAKKEYLDFVLRHWRLAADMVIKQKEISLVSRLLDQMGKPDKARIAVALDLAGEAGFAEGTAYLLEYMRKNFPAERKKFIL